MASTNHRPRMVELLHVCHSFSLLSYLTASSICVTVMASPNLLLSAIESPAPPTTTAETVCYSLPFPSLISYLMGCSSCVTVMASQNLLLSAIESPAPPTPTTETVRHSLPLRSHIVYLMLVEDENPSPMLLKLGSGSPANKKQKTNGSHGEETESNSSGSSGLRPIPLSRSPRPELEEDVGGSIGVADEERKNRNRTIPLFEKLLEQEGKRKVDDINLEGVRGYTTFARKVAAASERPIGVCAHVIWPWQGFDTKYIKEKGKNNALESINPLVMLWDEFVGEVDYILMERRVEDPVRIPITIRRKDTVLLESYMQLTDSVREERSCFRQAVHFFWAAWKGEEPWQVGAEEMTPGSDIEFHDREGNIIALPGVEIDDDNGNEVQGDVEGDGVEVVNPDENAAEWDAFIGALASIAIVEEVFNPWASDDLSSGDSCG